MPSRMRLHASTASSHGVPPVDEYFDRLIEQVDPHRGPPQDDRWRAKILAGQWLAVRRIHLNISLGQLSGRTGITLSTLMLIEAGLADARLAPPRSWALLAEALASRPPMATPTAAVVAVALGRFSALDPVLLAQVSYDLSQVVTQPTTCEIFIFRKLIRPKIR